MSILKIRFDVTSKIKTFSLLKKFYRKIDVD